MHATSGCSLGRAGQIIHWGLFKVWRLDLVVRSRRYLGAVWVDLAVGAGRPVTDRSQSALTCCWALGPLAYLAGWSRWVSAVWRRPAPGVRTAWARARRDPARMM